MRKVISIGLGLVMLVTLVATTGVQPARAASFIVNNNLSDAGDVNPGNGVCETGVGNGICTLRAAIQEANALAGDDIITLPAAVFTLTGASGEDAAASGDLDITSNITINGSSAATTTISGGGVDRVFHMLSGTVIISNVTISGGDPGGSANGGGILIAGGSVTINSSVVASNQAVSGGGIFVGGGALAANFTTIGGAGVGNTASATSGGGIHVASGAVATINNCTISDNQANNVTNGAGGGVFVASGGTVTLNTTTVSGNMASGSDVTAGGGGVFAAGTANLNSATVAANRASAAGGGVLQLGGAVNLRNTIIAGNTLPVTSPQCAGTMTSLGFNLIESMTGCGGVAHNVNGDIVVASINPPPTFSLDPLVNYGGPTFTHRLIAPGGSLAIDAGNPGGCTDGSSAFSNDQRGPGFIRNQNFRCDIGAFESAPTSNTNTPTFTFTPSITPTFTLTFTSSPTSSPAPTNTATPTFTNTPIPPSPSPSATPAPKIPLFSAVPPTPTIDLTQTTVANAALTSIAATAAAMPTSTPSAALTETSGAATSGTSTPAPTAGPTATITPTFAFPSETGVLSISQAAGRAGGRFTCGIWVLDMPKDAIPEGSAIHCQTVSSEDSSAPSLPSNLRGFWQVVDISITGSAGQPITTFTQPLLLCGYYSENYKTAAGGDAAQFKIYTSSEGEPWRALNTTADPVAPRVCAAPDHLSLFRLAAQPLSAAEVVRSTNVAGIVAIACGVLLLVVVIIVVIALLRRRSKKEEAKAK